MDEEISQFMRGQSRFEASGPDPMDLREAIAHLYELRTIHAFTRQSMALSIAIKHLESLIPHKYEQGQKR